MKLPMYHLLLYLSASICGAFGGESWISTAHEYAATNEKPYGWSDENQKYNGLELSDLIRALPTTKEWAKLGKAYRKSLPHNGTSEAEGTLTLLLLAYLDGNKGQVEALLKQTETALKTNDGHLDHIIESLRNAIDQNSEEPLPEQAVENFLKDLEQYQAITDERIIEIVGSAENLKKINAYLEAQKEIQEAYQVFFRDGMQPGQEAEVMALQARATKIISEHKKANDLIEAHNGQPVFYKYIINQQVSYNIYDSHTPSIAVPDLVSLVGEDGAREILTDALKAKVVLSIENADATLRLAREIALDHSVQLGAAQWGLTQSLGQVALYEAIAAQFPMENTRNHNYQLENAKAYYFWGLVAEGRSKDAIALLDSDPSLIDNSPYDVISNLRKAGRAGVVWEFLDQLLSERPSTDLWEHYMSLSAELDKSERMLEVVRKAVDTDSKKTKDPLGKLMILVSAFLSADEIDAAADMLEKAIQLKTSENDATGSQQKAAIMLASLGHLLERPEWVGTGLDSAMNNPADLIGEYGNVNHYSILELTGLLQELGKHTHALALTDKLIQDMDKEGNVIAAKNKKSNRGLTEDYMREDIDSIEAFRLDNKSAYQDILVAKLGILFELKDYNAVIGLLKDEPLWLVDDISGIISKSDQSPRSRKAGYILAQSLHQTGNSKRAASVIEATIREVNGYDPAYALYSEIKGMEAIEFYDKLYTLDPFQERPLIWKAQLLLNDGQVEAAEKVATLAISIDPSDGEQPKDDRMRVYHVMQQIREAQGNEKEAAFFADILKAIRTSEDADDYYAHGLHTRAIKRYLNSLNFFQNAYCIQSRVAVRLYDQGRTEEALKHYRKAYELMPSSFGRVESHCFGCESVFQGNEPQSIAEEVFSSLIEEDPKNPQVHYLMGYLRDHQQREADALKHLRKAVELDPDYLNAWKKISSLSRQMQFSQAEQDELILKIYSLDPLGNHSNPSLGDVSEIKVMWRAVLSNQEKLALIPKRTEVYPLKAAAALPAEDKADNDYYNFNRLIKHPADALENNPVIQAIEQAFIQLSTLDTSVI